MRSTLVAATAAASLLLGGCAGDDGSTEASDTPNATDEVVEDGAITGTVVDAQPTEQNTYVLTVETEDGETVELTTSASAYIDAPTERGSRQRQRLATWLQDNEFDGSSTYTFRSSGEAVVDVIAN